MKAITLKVLFIGITILTYSLPWTTVAGQKYSPSQFVVPWVKYGLVKFGAIPAADDTPPTLEEMKIYDKTLRYLSIPHSEGGPKFPVMFEVMAYMMVFTMIMLLIPSKSVNVIAYGTTAISSLVFALALLQLEQNTDFDFGLSGTIVTSLTLFITSFFI